MSNGDGVSQGDRNRNPARCVSRGSGLQMDLGRAGSPYALPAAFTGTGTAGFKRGRHPSAIRPAHLASFRRLKALVRPGPIRYGTGRRPGSALVPATQPLGQHAQQRGL